MSTLLEESLTVHTIEGIGEINLYEHCRRVVGIPIAPLPSCFQTYFCTQWLSNSYLVREKVSAGLLLELITQALYGKPSPNISYRNWTNAIVHFGKGCQVAPSKE